MPVTNIIPIETLRKRRFTNNVCQVMGEGILAKAYCPFLLIENDYPVCTLFKDADGNNKKLREPQSLISAYRTVLCMQQDKFVED